MKIRKIRPQNARKPKFPSWYQLGKNQRSEKLKNGKCMAIQNKVFISLLPEGTENLSFGYKNLKFG
ncbi:MAG: hypothetical protein NXH90_15300 [Flavobacteriaceae bacterium]|nr:hypothetical protein [Flavobacteriaceae bacterium]